MKQVARFEKYKINSVGRLFLHNNRTPDDGVTHSNENIDNDRTAYNYHLKKGTSADVNKRLSEVFCLDPSKANVLGEMVVTLPKDVKPEDERFFFEGVYDFYSKDFGEKNIVNAVVHKDEVTPHIHIDFVPVVKGDYKRKFNGAEELANKNGGVVEKLCCRDLITREYLQQMHKRLSDHMKEWLGYEVEILNGATVNGNKTVKELKLQEQEKEIQKQEREIQKKEKLVENLDKELLRFAELSRQLEIDPEQLSYTPLMEKMSDMENQIRVLQNIISRNNVPITKSDLEKFNEKTYKPVVGTSMSIMDGSMQDYLDSKHDSVIPVIEFNQSLQSRQSNLVTDDILEHMRLMIKENKKAYMDDNETYILILTDDEVTTFAGLMELERILQERNINDKKILMDRIENDTYNITCEMLSKLKTESVYFTNRSVADSSTEHDKENVRE